MGKKIVKAVLLGIVAVPLTYFAVNICWFMLQLSWVPSVNPNERWVSQDPDIWFVFFDEERNSSYGQIFFDDKSIEIKPAIAGHFMLHIIQYPTANPGVITDEDIMARGGCTYYNRWFTVEITFDRDGLFEGVDTITFYKEYITDNQLS